ncbi:MAG TPA: hypothetical protein GX702_12015 [Chloroflexi bacterium]|nr:hypothetical protein [Chloroflexota bacterium]
MRTQTEAFWRDEYVVSDDDLDLVTGLILESGRPQPIDNLASTVIIRRYQQEREAVTQQGRHGRIYRPMDQYDIGQEITFSALDFAVGRVVDKRAGYNPRYGEFEVVRVAFDDQPEREFASALNDPHPLNRPEEELLAGPDPELSEADMVRLFEHYVAERLEKSLVGNDEFVHFDDAWFLRALLPEIHVGHLNLAEAMIYEAGHELVAREMLGDLDLGAEGSTEAQLFALNHALSQDQRFDNVSMTESPVWYLRALEPEALFEMPAVLRPAFRAVGGEYIGLTMLDLVDEVGDSLDDIETLMSRGENDLHYEVTFPLLYAGAMPATQQFLRALPSVSGHHFPITLVDDQTGQQFKGWVMPSDRYVYGLDDWYGSMGMVVGGQVLVHPTDDPLVYHLAVTPSRSRRSDWIRSAAVEEGAVVLTMQRATVDVRCDREMLVDVPDREAIAQIMAQMNAEDRSLRELVRMAFLELAKLSAEHTVHAKGIYSVVNLMRRTGAVPIFAELTRHACYDPVGNGLWTYDPSLEGTIYKTPDDMRERPQSNRDNLIKDQVVEYLGR